MAVGFALDLSWISFQVTEFFLLGFAFDKIVLLDTLDD